MQKTLKKPDYPRRVPQPELRKGSLVYSVRVPVPADAIGGTFTNSPVRRSLQTRDKAEALRRVAGVYDGLLAEFATEAARLARAPATAVQAVSEVETPSEAAELAVPLLTVADAAQRYRQYIIDGDSNARKEATESALRNADQVAYDPAALALKFKAHLRRWLEATRGEAIVRDYQHADWYLTWLERKGIGRVADKTAAARELTLIKVRTLKEMLADDEEMTAGKAPTMSTTAPTTATTKSTAPLLSAFVESYIGRRGEGISDERADLIRDVTGDLIDVTGDKTVNAYTPDDATAIESVWSKLPPNWNNGSKKNPLTGLPIVEAANKAATLDLKRQSVGNIKKKWTALFNVFKHAAVKHKPLDNPFVAEALLLEDDGEHANQKVDPFTPDELHKLLNSDLKAYWEGRLYWITWIGIYTGARLNEICQLRKAHTKQHGDIYYIHIGPEFRLKGRGSAPKASIRSIPLHADLIKMGFLDFVRGQDDLLFPNIPQHKSGRYSDAAGKRFAYHLKRLGIKRPKLNCHSLRHTFSDRMKLLAPRDAETCERIIGHVIPGVRGRYGKDFAKEAMDMELLVERNKVLQMFTLPKPTAAA